MALLPKLIHATSLLKIYSWNGCVITVKDLNGKDFVSIDGGNSYPIFEDVIAIRDHFLNDARTYQIVMEPPKKRINDKIINIISK